MSYFLKEYRCKNCNKLFFKGDLKHCSIEIKCKNCKQLSTIEGVNCKLFLLLNKNKHNKDNLKVLKDIDIKDAILQCSDCEENKDCDSFKHLNDNLCPLCKKPVNEK